jgi:hypothetical protein
MVRRWVAAIVRWWLHHGQMQLLAMEPLSDGADGTHCSSQSQDNLWYGHWHSETVAPTQKPGRHCKHIRHFK